MSFVHPRIGHPQRRIQKSEHGEVQLGAGQVGYCGLRVRPIVDRTLSCLRWRTWRGRLLRRWPPSRGSPCLNDAIRAFLAVREGSCIPASTLRKHKQFVKQIRALVNSRGYATINQVNAPDQVNSPDIDTFYAN
jgi:hypothetical protein